MPFKKVGKDDYTGPSGRHFNYAQVKRYYSKGGHFAKGGDVREASYAKGGPVLGRTVDFMKVPDEFRDPDEANTATDKDQKYGKSGPGAGKGIVGAPPAKGKKIS
jgi:hypothetical protein